MGCDHAQGYFIARPLAMDALIAFLQPPAQAAIPAAAPRAVPVLLERAVAAAVCRGDLERAKGIEPSS